MSGKVTPSARLSSKSADDPRGESGSYGLMSKPTQLDTASRVKGPIRIFVAGGAGAIGRHLVPMLVEAGHHVVGTTRSAERAGWLHDVGATPAIVDVFEPEALRDAVVLARPEVVMHQLTDLAAGFAPDDLARTAKLRTVGTRHLVDATIASGGRRIIGQSGAWHYADGPLPYNEDHPLRTPSQGDADVPLRGFIELERLVTQTDGLEVVVLRYGFFYGPHTSWVRETAPAPPVSVIAAARATVLAVDRATPGTYNIVDDDPIVSNQRAKDLLGWTP